MRKTVRDNGLSLTSPYDLDARYCSQRDTHWVGYHST